jgi:hypothetical protein
MADEDPEAPLNLAQSDNLGLYVSRNHSLVTRVDDVYPLAEYTEE